LYTGSVIVAVAKDEMPCEIEMFQLVRIQATFCLLFDFFFPLAICSPSAKRDRLLMEVAAHSLEPLVGSMSRLI
jgi:hypothetical protein